MTRRFLLLGIALATLTLAAAATAQTPEPRRGGVIKMLLREDLPQGFSIHETATNSVTWLAR